MTTVTIRFTHFFLSLMVLVPQRIGLQKQFSVSAVPVPRSTEETQGLEHISPTAASSPAPAFLGA
jgi:hypothetical protein